MNAIDTLRLARPILSDDERPTFDAALVKLETLLQAAEALSDFLENEKETKEPPLALLDLGYVALESSADYEREEELGDALAAAVRDVRGEA